MELHLSSTRKSKTMLVAWEEKVLDRQYRKPVEHTANYSKRKEMSMLLNEINHAIKYLTYNIPKERVIPQLLSK